MRAGVAIVAILSLGLTMGAAPAAAFHGAAYTVPGEACLAGTPVCLPAQLTWGGGFGLAGGQYRLSIGTPAGATLPGFLIQGREQFTNFFFGNVGWCGFVERVNYLGIDSTTGGNDFSVTGVMQNCLGGVGGGQQRLDFTGHYKHVFTLAFQK